MASYLQRVVLIALILSIAVPISIGYRENPEDESDWQDYSGDDGDVPETGSDDSEIERYLRDLCSDTKKSKQCWKIIKPKRNRFTNTDIRNVVGIIIELAIEKSDEISGKLRNLRQESGDYSLKEKYLSCSKNYEDAHHNLDIVKGNLNFDNLKEIEDRVDDVKKELKSCKYQFGKKLNDPAHIRDRNKEFERYVEIVKTATKRFVKEKGGDNAPKH